MSRYISRSTFLKGLAGLSLAGISAKIFADSLDRTPRFVCRTLGPSRAFGHMLRDRTAPESSSTNESGSSAKPSRVKVAIVGGGIAGLSAAWWLKKHGLSDFVLLELEPQVGGNAASGKNQYSAYPWGAHYVPLANAESSYVRQFFEEIGVIKGRDREGAPLYNELYLCHDPQERLLKDGSFQEGLVPKRGLQPSDKQEIGRFFDMIASFRKRVGRDGKPAFAIPLDLSSQDPDLLALDKISMARWLADNGFHSRPLLWYANYCCRDDYGSTLEHVSAWAGIHYFAGRRGTAGNAEMNSVVTWPEGNGFLVNQLRKRVNDRLKTNSLVTRVRQSGSEISIDALATDTKNRFSLHSDYLIFAAPRFLAGHVIDGSGDAIDHKSLVYAPWLVANITVRSIPDSKGAGLALDSPLAQGLGSVVGTGIGPDIGSDLAWDNVSYQSQSLGYVVANHQDITTRQGPIVITYYYPLSGDEPRKERMRLLDTTSERWSKIIIADLEKMHPGIKDQILSMDLWPWGHGMIRPSVGYLWGETRRKMKEPQGRILFAHSDMSGISNFEEAQYHGIEAARKVLAELT